MKPLFLWIAAVIVSFGAGLLLGRQFPAHHYEKFGVSRMLLDTTTGMVCDPLPKPLNPPSILDGAPLPSDSGYPPCEAKN